MSPAIPVAVEDINTFENTLDEVSRFSEALTELGWHKPPELGSWTSQIPRLWLSRRRAYALDRVRLIVYRDSGEYKKAERVEKQQISQTDGMFQDNNADAEVEDDWNANWEEDNDDGDKAAANAGVSNDEEEDVSAWGLDDDDEDKAEPEEKIGKENEEDDDVDDAWGWGDDETNDNPPEDKPRPTTKTSKIKKNTQPPPAQKEVTLREFYTVTKVPDAIVKVIADQISDSERLKQTE